MSKPSNTPVTRYDDCGTDGPDFSAQRSGRRPGRRKGSKSTRTQPTLAEEHAGDPRWRPDVGPRGALWARFRGRGRRGRQPLGVDPLFDLRRALVELGEAHRMLAKAFEIDRGKQKSRARAAAIAVVVGKLELASRFVDEVCVRCGHPPPDCTGEKNR